MATYNTYTEEQEHFLFVNAPLLSRKELTELFNWKFGVSKSVGVIKSWCNSRGYNSANDGRFKAGCETWQKGLRGDDYKSHFTDESFARGLEKMLESNKTAKLGDEYVKNGTVYVVTSLKYGIPFDQRRAPKRRVVWERAHGKIPDDCSIIHLDGNPLNCEPENLYCLPNKYKSIMAKNGWYTDSREHTLTAIKWCELFYMLKGVTQ